MTRQTKRIGVTSPFVVAALLVCVVAIWGWWTSAFLVAEADKEKPVTHLSDVARRTDAPPNAEQLANVDETHAVTISPGPATPRMSIAISNQPSSVTVSCSTCHNTRPANVSNKTPSDLDEFHQGLEFTHNSLSCLSCHNSKDYDTLQLADGSEVQYADVMRLCAQCHGPQTRDYEHGAHGGMTGYWDLSRGPRQRNNCVDCHHPHTPQFPMMKPTFKPRDRFLNPAHSADARTDGKEHP